MTIAPSTELRADLLGKQPTKQITEKSSDSFEEVKHDEALLRVSPHAAKSDVVTGQNLANTSTLF